MGAASSKSPLERRNTVLKRSQRKSIHHVRDNLLTVMKEIKKFKGVDEDVNYVEIKAKIENLQRELTGKSKNLQVQLKPLYNETTKKIEDSFDYLEEKLKENQEKAAKKQNVSKLDNEETEITRLEEEQQLEETTNKRRTVELKVIQIHTPENSPDHNKRESVIKMGVPVMPQSIMDEALRKSFDHSEKIEKKLVSIRANIEKIEEAISQFVGKKYGRHYNVIKEQLSLYGDELQGLHSNDEEIHEQVKMCLNYVKSCLSFLDEKAVDVELEIEDEVFTPTENHVTDVDKTLSPKSIRTTYI